MAATGLFYEILQSLVEGVAIEDRSGRLVFANRALEQLLGYQVGELAGVPWTGLFAVESRLETRVWKATESSPIASRHRAGLLHRDGTEIPVLVGARRLAAGDGEEVILSTFSALQEPRTHRSESRASEETDLADKQRSTVVHELSNSLATIVLQSRLLANRGEGARQHGESLSVIQEQAQRMMRMVDSLRSNEDPLRPGLETVDVGALVRQTLDVQKHHLQEDGIEVIADLPDDLPSIQADPYQLQQVFVNLVNNARQAMEAEPRGGTLVVAANPATSENESAARIQIRFVDDGPGIPPEVMPLIFRPFFTTKKREEGMGLGLSICHQIVQRHGGAIWAENNVTGGATFVLELPVVERREGDEMTPPNLLDPQPSQAIHLDKEVGIQHILVVDDEPAVANSASQLLQDAGFRVTIAFDAQRALALLDRESIDLIISDLAMPRMSGQQFWKAVADSHPHLTGRIIFSTGDSGSRRARTFLRENGCAWIEKPFQGGELLSLVHKVLPYEGALDPSPA